MIKAKTYTDENKRVSLIFFLFSEARKMDSKENLKSQVYVLLASPIRETERENGENRIMERYPFTVKLDVHILFVCFDIHILKVWKTWKSF